MRNKKFQPGHPYDWSHTDIFISCNIVGLFEVAEVMKLLGVNEKKQTKEVKQEKKIILLFLYACKKEKKYHWRGWKRLG